ncbi:MAG: ribosome silencing factor [Flavobacteriales bacterium]|jgi:ribosome-associated protein|nr:ribosome silencing factor [Flavobacteriales bacterium]MDG1005264.1 ribosome silencing factor [Schleiferiaceae bacterium]NCF57378.1 ribosome silencing factor [Bacteroidota bacterium]MBT3572861.1 ribosome silencing factor [Flavobacteriales bacterium]MBT3677386.1 ribosome silencing factor [Flavobacteriales bacterium]
MKSTFPDIVHHAIEGIANVKGENIKVLDLRQLDNAVTDFFVIAEAQSTTQVSAMSDSAMKEIRENLNDRPWHREGHDTASWILLDYVQVVVHLFQRESREFYDLEGLWNDASITSMPS